LPVLNVLVEWAVPYGVPPTVPQHPPCPTEGLASKTVPMSAPEIAKAITANLVCPDKVTVIASELSAELPTAYHSSRYIKFPDPVAR